MIIRRILFAFLLVHTAVYAGDLRVSLNTHPYFLMLGISRNIEVGATYGLGSSRSEIGIKYGFAGIYNSSGDLAIANPDKLGDVWIGALQFANVGYYQDFGKPPSLFDWSGNRL